MEFVFFGVVAAAMAIGAAMASARAADERARRALVVARKLGLELYGDEDLRGTYLGVAVHVYVEGASRRNEPTTVVQCRLLEALPPGMTITPKGVLEHLGQLLGNDTLELGGVLDDVLFVRCRDRASTRELLDDEEVLDQLRRLVAQGARITLKDPSLELLYWGRDFRRTIQKVEAAVGLVRALAETRRVHWRAFAERHQLTLGSDELSLRGTIDGVSFVLEDGKLTVPLITALPTGTRVVHEVLGRSEVDFREPILDATLAARTSDVEALRARLMAEALRAPLLETLHGRKGSVLLAERLVVPLPWAGTQLAPTVEAALAVVRLLG